MIKNCPVRGKAFDVFYPDLWRYKRGSTYFCSWGCIRKYDGQFIGKDENDMTRMRKDGTPAKKSGPKPKKIETPEHMAAEDMGLDLDKTTEAGVFETTAIRHKNLGEFYFDHDHNCIDWRNGLGDEVSLSPAGWKMMITMLPKILQALGVDIDE